MLKSIKLKLMVIYLALVFIVMIASGTFMLTSMKIQETNKSLESLRSFAKNIDEQVVQVSDPMDFQKNLRIYSAGGGTGTKIYGYILNKEGKTIASTEYTDDYGVAISLPQFYNQAVISAVAGTPKDNVGKVMEASGQFKEWVNFATPVTKDGAEPSTYIIFTRTEAKPMNDRLMEIGTTFVFTVMLALILTGLLGFLFANTLTVPIIKLTKSAKVMAQGTLDQEIPVYSNDEIGQLTESFNFMAKELSEFMATMASEKNKMEVILHNMSDGILAYDSDGHLLHANSACFELLNTVDIEALPFEAMMQVLGSPLTDLRALTPALLADTTFPMGERFIGASFSSYENKDGTTTGIVIVLSDVTRHKKLDDMRKEFVANVSHEIRTPLTTIKTYAETLLDMGTEEEELALAQNFLSIIIQEADRMTLLTQDLLELSRFDNKQMLLDFTEINLITILRQCIKQNTVLADKKNQNIVFNTTHKDFWIYGDGARINQVFTNIINNAIKYSNEETTITIYTEETDKYYRIYIKDRGIGIPREDVGRIFERFYRVDKTRSRAMGGTGLGLSIAKEIMEAHEGKIFISSEPGRGTTMVLRFKKHEPEPEED